MRKLEPIHVVIVFCLLWLAFGDFKGCTFPVTQKVTAVVYTYDDKQHFVPPPVAAALNTLNRNGITATLDEVDTTDESGDVPEQYKISRPAAVAAGLPAAVVLAGDKVRRVVPKPTTEEQVLGAAK